VEFNISAATLDIIPINDTAVKPTMMTYSPIRISIGNIGIEVTTGFDETALAAVIKAVK